MNERADKLFSNLLKTASIVAGVSLWHVLAVYVLNDPTFLVSPMVVVHTAYDMFFVTGEIYPHLFASSWIFFYGFALAILAVYYGDAAIELMRTHGRTVALVVVGIILAAIVGFWLLRRRARPA